ncbi:LCP family protein [Candidatus Saccharibacteria bacterium]|nr:LCP family protein [Candidatus Saccharibacteria bacterium]
MKKRVKDMTAKELDKALDEPELVNLSPKGAKAKKQRKKRIALWVSLGFVFLLLAGIGALIFVVSNDLGKSFSGGIFGLLQKEKLKTDEHGRTNVLIFGADDIGLTDSIMVASVDQETGDRLTFSVPRDLYVKHGCGKGKINEVYSCEVRRGKTEAEAAQALASKITEITGVEVQYVVSLDFTVLKELVDRVGGIEVVIPHNMAEENGSCNFRYKEGQVVKMNGEQALCFSRARNSNGGYGIPNDFERGRNQQRVIRSLQTAALNDGKLLTPTAALSTIDSMGKHLRTSLHTNELRSALDLLKGSGDGNDRGEYTFMDKERGVYLLRDECTVSTTEAPCGANGGQMILVPAGTTDWYNYAKIHEHFAEVMAG